MECKISMPRGTGLWCSVHQTDEMSGECAVAIENLRKSITGLEAENEDLRERIRQLEGS